MSPIVYEEIATLLGQVPLFSALQPADLLLVAECCEARQAARGELIFSQGQPCEGFFVVISGQVKLFAVSPAGQEKVATPPEHAGGFGCFACQCVLFIQIFLTAIILLGITQIRFCLKIILLKPRHIRIFYHC